MYALGWRFGNDSGNTTFFAICNRLDSNTSRYQP